MATVGDIINAAGRKVGIFTFTTDETAYAIEALNNLIAIMGIEHLAPYVTRENLTLTIGDAEYTIGSGGDLNTVRPLAINNIYIKDSDGYSYPINLINVANYNEITSKTQDGRPENVYYIPEYPLAKIIFDYEPDEAYVAYFEFQKSFTEYTATTDTVTLPNEYKPALVYNLALAIAEDNSVVPNETVTEMAGYTKLMISKLQAINSPPKKVRFDIYDDGVLSNIEIGE